MLRVLFVPSLGCSLALALSASCLSFALALSPFCRISRCLLRFLPVALLPSCEQDDRRRSPPRRRDSRDRSPPRREERRSRSRD